MQVKRRSAYTLIFYRKIHTKTMFISKPYQHLCVLVGCIVCVSTVYTHTSRDTDTCSYSFQVWKPEQDIVDKLRTLETRFTNITAAVDYRLLSMRNQVITEVLNTQNVTSRLEKELLEQKLKHVQQTVDVKDLKLHIIDIEAETRKLRDIVETLDDKKPSAGVVSRHRRPGPTAIYHVQKEEADTDTTRLLVGQLRNSVGDLKAEWLLIKREVNEIKTENLQTKFQQEDLKADTIKLKSLIEDIKSKTDHIDHKLETLTEPSQGHGPAQQTQGTSMGGVDRSDVQRLRTDLETVRSRCNLLENEVVRLAGLSEELRHEALTILHGKRNITAENIARLLQKMAAENPENPGTRERLLVKESIPPADCQDVYSRGHRVSGVYEIQPAGSVQPDRVYCELAGGAGWTLLSRRQDGTLNFDRGWQEYKNGFGSLYGEFWIGNEVIHKLTYQKRYKLRVDMWDWEGGRAYAEYDTFSVTDANDKYRIQVSGYTGNAGDSLSYHDKMAFSTVDSDNDLNMNNCAEDNKGGWWFNSCYSSNLNGAYHVGWYTKTTYSNGVTWYTLKESEFYSLRAVEMKVRPMYL